MLFVDRRARGDVVDASGATASLVVGPIFAPLVLTTVFVLVDAEDRYARRLRFMFGGGIVVLERIRKVKVAKAEAMVMISLSTHSRSPSEHRYLWTLIIIAR